MLKRLTLLLVAIMFVSSVIANPQKRLIRDKAGEKHGVRAHFDRSGLTENVLLSEDFSKFTAGSEEDPDDTRLDDDDMNIDDAYFNTPGWSGLEVYQAGGCAYIGFSQEYGESGMICTPLINTSGPIFIKCRMRSENPEGEVVGYNIFDEYYEFVDANVDFIEVTQDWTDVSWFTTSGCENSSVWIYSYSTNVFIDDIEIISLTMPTPVLLDETDITNDAFTANWEAVEAADAYLFNLFAEHTATSDETFYYTNTYFNSISSQGTIASPEAVDGWELNVDGWHIYMPILIDEAIGITGRYSSLEQYGALTSPVSDFSSNNGNVNLSFKAYGKTGDEITVNLLTPAKGYYDIASTKTITIEKEGWIDYSMTLTKGMEESYIDISYFGDNDVFFDDLKLYQPIEEGEKKTIIIYNEETADTSFRAKVESDYLNDELYYQVASSQYVYAPNSTKKIGNIDSEFTEERHVTLNSAPQETDTIAIGEGSLNTYYAPISNYGSAKFSLSQQIYTKEDINKESGDITSISFHNNKGNSNTREITVYMSNTKQEAYRDNKDWVIIEESQIVYEGSFTFAATGEWSTIELQKPFTYTGDNLALTIYDKSDLSMEYSGNHDTFFASATDTLRGLYKTASSEISIYTLSEVYGFELKTDAYATPAHQYYVSNIKFTIEPSSKDNTISHPKNVTAFAESTSSIRISWTGVKNATSYNVYRGSKMIANVGETVFIDENLGYDEEYCYTITALNDKLESGKSEEVCEKTLGENIDELTKSFNIYPNPAENEIYISSEERIEEVAIYNINGQQTTVNGQQTSSIGMTINVSNLNPGVYFIKINDKVEKFIKK